MGKNRVNTATATQGDECYAGPRMCDRGRAPHPASYRVGNGSIEAEDGG